MPVCARDPLADNLGVIVKRLQPTNECTYETLEKRISLF